MQTHLFGAVEEGIANIPPNAIAHSQPPRQTRLVQVDQQSSGQISQLHILKVKAGARGAEKGRQARQQQGQVAEARDASDERRRRRGWVRNVQWDPRGPEGLSDGIRHYHGGMVKGARTREVAGGGGMGVVA